MKPEDKKLFWATEEEVLNWFASRLCGLFKRYGPEGINGPEFELLTNKDIKTTVTRPRFRKDLRAFGLTWEDVYILAIEKYQEEEQKSNEEIVRAVGKGIFH